MPEASAEFDLGSLEPHVPTSAAQADRTARRSKSATKPVVVELTARQQLGNRIFFYSLMTATAWIALCMDWQSSVSIGPGFRIGNSINGFNVRLNLFRQTIPASCVAAIVSVGSVMSVTNLLKLTGLRRRYILGSFVAALLLTLLSSATYSGPGLWLTLLITILTFSYSWANRSILR